MHTSPQFAHTAEAAKKRPRPMSSLTTCAGPSITVHVRRRARTINAADRPRTSVGIGSHRCHYRPTSRWKIAANEAFGGPEAAGARVHASMALTRPASTRPAPRCGNSGGGGGDHGGDGGGGGSGVERLSQNQRLRGAQTAEMRGRTNVAVRPRTSVEPIAHAHGQTRSTHKCSGAQSAQAHTLHTLSARFKCLRAQQWPRGHLLPRQRAQLPAGMRALHLLCTFVTPAKPT